MEVAGLTKEKIFEIVIHTIAWGLLFCSPFLFAYGDNASVSLERYVGFVIMPLTFMTVFYVNYGILTPRLLFRKRLGRFILANLLLIAAVLLIQHIWHEMCRLYIETEPPPENRGDPPPVYFFIAWNAMLMALTVGLAVAIRMTGNWYRIEAEKQQIEKERTQAELKNLKSQLNPHFLFNTLNNIYALIPIDRTKAQFAVHSLSHMLRYVLYENNQNYIPLEKEIQFVRNYVELMELRLPDRVETTVDLPEQADGYTIAPLLFITLVENAFKHGVSPSQPSFVHISIRMVKEGTLVCTIENSDFPKTDADRSGSGIGLQNLRKRLNLLYPNRHILRTENLNGSFVAQLIIDL